MLSLESSATGMRLSTVSTSFTMNGSMKRGVDCIISSMLILPGRLTRTCLPLRNTSQYLALEMSR